MPEPEATPPAEPDDDQHVCKPGASVYYCPTAGETESDCHGGFDVCCGRIDLHQQLVPCSLAVLKRPHNAHPWEPQPGMDPVHCEGANPAPGADQRCSCGGRGVTHFHADRHEPAPAVPVPGLRDQIAGAVDRLRDSGGVYAIDDPERDRIADAVLAVVQPAIDKAQQRAEAMERAMEDTAADALKHRGCHRSLMGQVQRAETAEALLARVKALHQQYAFGSDPQVYCAHCNSMTGGWIPWPCPTIAALTPPVPADQPEGGAG